MKIKYIKNERGIALVMVLILALIGLAIVSALMYMMTQGTTMSAGQKFYRTAEEASYGGVELATGYLSGRGLLNIAAQGGFSGLGFNANCSCGTWDTYNDNVDNMTGARSDRCDKICNPTANWQNGAPATAAQTALDNLTTTADLQFNLAGTPSIFTVFVKIVDTVQGTEPSESMATGGGQLGGAGVTESNSSSSGAQKPNLYRLEVQSQATANPRERARLSVLYAY